MQMQNCIYIECIISSLEHVDINAEAFLFFIKIIM